MKVLQKVSRITPAEIRIENFLPVAGLAAAIDGGKVPKKSEGLACRGNRARVGREGWDKGPLARFANPVPGVRLNRHRPCANLARDLRAGL